MSEKKPIIRKRIDKPATLGAAITVGLCPICFPAIGGLLSALGLGFLVNEAVLKPLLWVFLTLSLGGLFWSYRKEHHQLRPFLLGCLMAASLYTGRYYYINFTFNVILMYGGIVGLIAATLWNLRLKKAYGCRSCADLDLQRELEGAHP